MAQEQIYIGNFAKGLVLNRLPFNIDNDAFPKMFNFYSWRGRAKRKRGTIFLGQLDRQIQSAASATNWKEGPITTLNGSGAGSANLISVFSLETTATIAPGSITLSDGTNTFTEPATPNGTLVGAPGGSGTINYATGAITITGGAAGQALIGKYSYFPTIPVMGLLDLALPGSNFQYPLLLAFDTTYAYQYNSSTNLFYSVSYYLSTNNPVTWSGQDYQLFWSTNYEGAFWATNSKPGFHFLTGTYSSGSTTTTITFNFKLNGVNFTTLVVGDKLWFNEWAAGGVTLNGITGTVSNISGAASGNYVVTFGSSQTVSSTGIVQLLTNSIPGQDGIKWYNGDMTGGTGLPTSTSTGWVNFAPPLTASTVSIDTNTARLYYLIGALAIFPYKDRLVFFNVTIGASDGTVISLTDTVIWSWNGTPYYAAPTPTNETFDVRAYYVDQTGFGGFLSAGFNQNITSVNSNEDAIIVGFTSRQTRFVYTGNDLQPFLFYNINNEFGPSSPFSGINMDRGAVTLGTKGIFITTQQQSIRIDVEIPDSVFQVNAANNGALRVNSARDFFREWIYLAYPINSSQWKYPTNTFFWNYRDNTWGIFYENFTAQGTFRRQSGYAWATLPFPTWATWTETWNSPAISAQFPNVIGGNPQGFVLIKGEGTGEGLSGTIEAITAAGSGLTQITSPNHCVAVGDYIYILGCIGITTLNMTIHQVNNVVDANNFVIDVNAPAGTYLGLGRFARLSLPLIQTKQFPFYWSQGKKLRLGVQKYLLDTTDNAQVTLNIYLSQNPDDVWNTPSNQSVEYSQILYTCPESINIGLTPANTNLQMPTAEYQYQIWHRVNTSLIGDSVQLGITLSDAQMRNLTYATSEITLHGVVLNISPGPDLA